MSTATDVATLRELAKKVVEIAHHPENIERRSLWLRHNRLEKTRPLFVSFPEMAWAELVPESKIRCRDPLFRTYEWSMRRLVYRWEHIHDDFVIEPDIRVPFVYTSTGYGLDIQKLTTERDNQSTADFAYNDGILSLISILGEYRDPFGTDANSSYRHVPQLKDPADLDKLHYPEIQIDDNATDESLEKLSEALATIVPVGKIGFAYINCSLAGDINALRGMEQVMFDIYDRPHWLSEAITFLVESVEDQIKQAEKNGWLAQNGNGGFLCSSLSYTDELPANDSDFIKTSNQWGHATIQSAPDMAPEKQEEFFIKHQRRLLSRFGLNMFGCCERLTKENLEFIKLIPNLRKLIVSPWSDLDETIASLADDYILAWKPHPTQMTSTFDMDSSRNELVDFLNKARDCHTEIVLKDIGTFSGEPDRLDRYSRMAHEVVREHE